MSSFQWTDDDKRAVDTARILSADAVQKVGNGHPGSAISLAAVAYLLYQKVMNIDPADEHWLGRDRFVLSSGHASVLQYCQLYLGGLGLEMADLQALRTAGSKTPGHPEYGHTRFIECTTGPLGAGVSNAVGMAMAARRQRGLYDPDATGPSVFDHNVFVITGDGCLQEGVAAEAVSLAGTQRLGNLVLIYDDNQITIEGDTRIAFTDDIEARFAACGWHTQHVAWRHGTSYSEDVPALYDAIEAALAVTDKPSLIKLDTIIAWPSPTMAGSEKTHGNALGEAEITRLKALLGFEDVPFAIDEALVGRVRANLAARGAAARQAWDARYRDWRAANPQQAGMLDRVQAHRLPDDLTWPAFEPGATSTRAASGAVLAAIADQLPELWGGSADLAGSNDTTMKGQPSFLPDDRVTPEWPGGPDGRTLHFGVREHAMGGVLNGINLEGLTRAYGGTFFVFSDYMRPPVRLAALMGLPTIFVWTHDSIGVGEDGPTHQPIEQLAACRAIPNLAVVRPMDANEVAEAWRQALLRTDGPTALILTRQNVPTVPRGDGGYASADGLARGGYVLKDAAGEPAAIIIATGSEVSVALGAADLLDASGVPTRVVSMPCQEWFDAQPQSYRDEVLPPAVGARVSVEAGIAMGWHKYVGNAGACVSIEHFGESASGPLLFQQYGFTPEHVAQVVKDLR